METVGNVHELAYLQSLGTPRQLRVRYVRIRWF